MACELENREDACEDGSLARCTILADDVHHHSRHSPCVRVRVVEKCSRHRVCDVIHCLATYQLHLSRSKVRDAPHRHFVEALGLDELWVVESR